MASLISDMQCRIKARDALYLLTSQAQIRERQIKDHCCAGEFWIGRAKMPKLKNNQEINQP